MFETHTTRTYDDAFARARAERAAAFRRLFSLAWLRGADRAPTGRVRTV
ncbi:MAG: hypothetical protein AAF366_08555 [Pseudomonadota bacterium]